MLKKIIVILVVIILIIVLFKNDEKIIEISNDTTINDRYTKEEYYGYLKIPSINMNLGFYDYDNHLNDVESNIELIKIQVENSYLIAAHSGVGDIAYFNDLRALEVGDDIYLEILDEEKHFQVTNIYRTIKDGDISISENSDMIYLTTCDQIVKGYQLVIEGVLVS